MALELENPQQRESAHNRFERALAANPAPAAILRLADSHYVRANRGFLDMTGFAPEQVIHRPFRELDVLREAEHREAALAADKDSRRLEILGLICKGRGDAEIAAALHISGDTVRNHVANLYGKIGVRRRGAAVVWGRERGIGSY